MTIKIEAPISFHIAAQAIFEIAPNGQPQLLRIEVIECTPIALAAAEILALPESGTVH